MEIFLVYLYGIYGSIDAFLILVTAIVVITTLGGALLKAMATYEQDKYTPTSQGHTEWNRYVTLGSKFIYLKVSIMLIILNILVPPKNIAVAMVAAPYAVEAGKAIGTSAIKLVESNTTAKLSQIIDLSLDKAITKLKD